MAKVTAIPATKTLPVHSAATPLSARRRVAAYARVSTDLEEQQSSYQAQIDYYTGYITSRADWEFAGMYSDEGISGTSAKHREGFQNMVADALAGKIDLIITKSVSRFARNTVDSLTTVRSLKDAGVEVYFEKENIWTLDSKGELLITIMSSLAQEESRSISENVTWGHRKHFAEGKVQVPYASLLGYKKGPNGAWSSTTSKPRSSAGSTPSTSQATQPSPSPRPSPPTVYPLRSARKCGPRAPSARSCATRNTKATPCCKRPSPSTS
jgi:site-specific recombinase